MIRVSDNVTITRPFFDLITNGFDELKADGETLKTIIQYQRWNDTDQPGIDERITLQSSMGTIYHGAITHNRWSKFERA